jgi:hypothetical protein
VGLHQRVEVGGLQERGVAGDHAGGDLERAQQRHGEMRHVAAHALAAQQRLVRRGERIARARDVVDAAPDPLGRHRKERPCARPQAQLGLGRGAQQVGGRVAARQGPGQQRERQLRGGEERALVGDGHAAVLLHVHQGPVAQAHLARRRVQPDGTGPVVTHGPLLHAGALHHESLLHDLLIGGLRRPHQQDRAGVVLRRPIDLGAHGDAGPAHPDPPGRSFDPAPRGEP